MKKSVKMDKKLKNKYIKAKKGMVDDFIGIWMNLVISWNSSEKINNCEEKYNKPNVIKDKKIPSHLVTFITLYN